ncbi:MAG: hypothetical protein K2Q18_14195, partial [Bdellovibrionales bacterium]|nr:hypothetical protein [Bdellovibrionales bacterium]
SYKNTDNTGINKLERIGVIETYLTTLSATLKGMEAKVLAAELKTNAMEAKLLAKEDEIKKLKEEIASTKELLFKSTIDPKELDRLKADILEIKNEDIEKIRILVQGLNYSVQSIQGLLESRKSGR